VEEGSNYLVVPVGVCNLHDGIVIMTTGWTLQVLPTLQLPSLFVQTAVAEFVATIAGHRRVTRVLADLAAEMALQECQQGGFDLLQFFLRPTT